MTNVGHPVDDAVRRLVRISLLGIAPAWIRESVERDLAPLRASGDFAALKILAERVASDHLGVNGTRDDTLEVADFIHDSRALLGAAATSFAGVGGVQPATLATLRALEEHLGRREVLEALRGAQPNQPIATRARHLTAALTEISGFVGHMAELDAEPAVPPVGAARGRRSLSPGAPGVVEFAIVDYVSRTLRDTVPLWVRDSVVRLEMERQDGGSASERFRDRATGLAGDNLQPPRLEQLRDFLGHADKILGAAADFGTVEGVRMRDVATLSAVGDVLRTVWPDIRESFPQDPAVLASRLRPLQRLRPVPSDRPARIAHLSRVLSQLTVAFHTLDVLGRPPLTAGGAGRGRGAVGAQL